MINRISYSIITVSILKYIHTKPHYIWEVVGGMGEIGNRNQEVPLLWWALSDIESLFVYLNYTGIFF